MNPASRPYEIKERVFVFACDVIRAYPRERLDSASHKVWAQLIASATSSGAHLEEAAAGGSRAQFLALNRGALREMRESNYWLRVLTATELHNFRQAGSLQDESRELVAVLTTIVRRTYENGKKKKREE
jgi:four helix bundle protein